MKVGYHRTISSPYSNTYTILSPPPYKTITLYTFPSPHEYCCTFPSPSGQNPGSVHFFHPAHKLITNQRDSYIRITLDTDKPTSRRPLWLLQLDLTCITGSDEHQVTGRVLRREITIFICHIAFGQHRHRDRNSPQPRLLPRSKKWYSLLGLENSP